MNRYKQHKKIVKNAFTLVEVMVAILLTTIVLTTAYMIWSRVRLGIARSTTKQTLQNELRKAANHMQNDFKSIKIDDTNTVEVLESNRENFSIKFKKFKETSEDGGKVLSQDVTEDVEYNLNSSVLKRVTDKTSILSSHCEGVTLIRADENEESLGQEFQDARNAKLDIEISGKMKVPGTNEELYHIEKTSVVMRNEYYKMINQNYKSNFDIQGLNKNDVIKEGSEESIDLSEVPDKILQDMLESWEDTIAQCKSNLDNIDEAIKGENPDVSLGSRLWAWLGGSNLYGEFNNEKEALLRATEVEEVNSAVDDIQAGVDEQEAEFCERSYSGYSGLSDERKLAVKKVYDMAVHDKTVEKSYDDLSDEQKEGTQKPVSNFRILELQSQGKSLVEIDANGNEVTQDLEDDEKKQEAAEMLEIYRSLDVSWVTEDSDEINIYRSRKSLLESASTKIELIKVKDEAVDNKGKVEQEINNRSNS